MNENSSNGFTLIELIVTMAIAVILITVAAPSFTESLRGNRLATTTNDFMSSLLVARSEAVKRGGYVTVCKKNSAGTDCDNSAQWENGWIVFADSDGDKSLDHDGDTNVCESGQDADCVIKVHDALSSSFTLNGDSNFTNTVTYTSNGQTTTSGSLVLCDNRDGNGVPEARTSRVIIINNVGRVQVGIDIDNDEIPEINGTEIDSCTSPFTP